MAQVRAALAADQLFASSAVGAEGLSPHMVRYMVPETRKATTRVKFLFRCREKGAAADSAAIYILCPVTQLFRRKFVPDAHLCLRTPEAGASFHPGARREDGSALYPFV